MHHMSIELIHALMGGVAVLAIMAVMVRIDNHFKVYEQHDEDEK